MNSEEVLWKSFVERYSVQDVQRNNERICAYGRHGEVLELYPSPSQTISINFDEKGFKKLLQECSTVPLRCKTERLDLNIGEDEVFVLRYPIDEFPSEVVATAWDVFKNHILKGKKGICIPKEFDVSVTTIEQLIEMRDQLTELIQNLSYENVMGFK